MMEHLSLKNPRIVLFSLWIFVTLNYIYCDVFSLMDSTYLKLYIDGEIEGMKIDENFLLGAAVLMEIPMLMIIGSLFLPFKTNRIANIVSGSIKTLVMIATMFIGVPSKYYLFCGVIEIATTTYIVWYAYRWKE